MRQAFKVFSADRQSHFTPAASVIISKMSMDLLFSFTNIVSSITSTSNSMNNMGFPSV